MVERQEVEALLVRAQSVAPADAVFGEERIGVEGSTLAALCRAWLEVNKEPSNQNQGTQKEGDPFDSWFAEHYPDVNKLGKDDPMAAGFRHAMKGSFKSK